MPIQSIWSELERQLLAGRRVVLATVVRALGSAPQVPGAKMVIRPDGSSFGTIGGGCVEGEARTVALRVLTGSAAAGLYTFDLGGLPEEDGVMMCGGRMEVLIDLFQPEAEG